MEGRRSARAVIDPKVRRVGFFTPSRSLSYPPESNSPPSSNYSPAPDPLSYRHLSDNLSSRTAAVPVPVSLVRRPSAAGDHVQVGSYNPSESLLGTPSISPTSSSGVGFMGGEFSEESVRGFRRSFQGSELDSKIAIKPSSENFTAPGVEVKKPVDSPASNHAVKSGGATELHDEPSSNSNPLKLKTTKAERRALQESQRAAKAASKGLGGRPAVVSGRSVPGKSVNQPLRKKIVPHPEKQKDGHPVISSAAVSDNKGGDRPLEKDRKKQVPPPRMQFDDISRVEKAKRRAVVNQSEARNRVELFRHLPQYERGTQLPDLESKFFKLDPVHPAVYKVGMQYLAGDLSGGNARCIAMLRAFKEVVKDYSTPPEKTLVRDLPAKISSYVSFLIECRPISISMGNAIRFIKFRMEKLPFTLPESEAKAALCLDIDRFINEKIILADKVIVRHAVTKIRDGDVLLTYGSSGIVEMILLYAHELRKQFRVVVVDSRPKLEGQVLLSRLVAKGLSCTYTHINAISYIMHDVTRVFLGASSIFSNGTVYSRVGTASVAMVAHAFHVPVLICCEAYKFHERVQLDSICFNELGDSEVVAKIPGRMDVTYLENCGDKENLQLLNLIYDATPSDYVSMIITDYGTIPPTSVPVIVREYQEYLWI